MPGTARPTRACRKWRAPSRGRAGTARTSSVCGTERLESAGVLPRIACVAVVELAEVDPVAQQMRERAVGQRHTPDGPARAQPAPSRDDAALPQLALQCRERSELKVALADEPHRRGLILPDHELALPHVVSERHDAADPNALAFGGGDLVPMRSPVTSRSNWAKD